MTGDAGFGKHWGNMIFEYGAEGRRERPLAVGELFDVSRYPVATSDVLAHLLHEHQVGFVNRVLVGSYRTRELLAGAQGRVGSRRRARSSARAVDRALHVVCR